MLELVKNLDELLMCFETRSLIGQRCVLLEQNVCLVVAVKTPVVLVEAA